MAMRARLRSVGTTRPVSNCDRKLADSPVWRPSSTSPIDFFKRKPLDPFADVLLGDKALGGLVVDLRLLRFLVANRCRVGHWASREIVDSGKLLPKSKSVLMLLKV